MNIGLRLFEIKSILNFLSKLLIIFFISNSGDALKCVNILHSLGYDEATIDDCRVLQEICIAVSLRAARLAAAGLTCIVRVIMFLIC